MSTHKDYDYPNPLPIISPEIQERLNQIDAAIAHIVKDLVEIRTMHVEITNNFKKLI